ncbi:hypothetical protein CDLVIII_5846 [Clostridium sp. DL-VIII]|nr:hypothetical protein CDLVIII_5846 [Clostridium sp. DL-VIII]OOM81185.1 hypothetical protein CLOBL_02930 [Clostridium sp. BL-8]
MKEFINILINNKDFKRSAMLTIALVLILMVYIFQASTDLPFVYSQF